MTHTSGRTRERWQWRPTANSPKLQHYWNLAIRLFSGIVGGLTPLQRSSWCILQRQPTVQILSWCDMGRCRTQLMWMIAAWGCSITSLTKVSKWAVNTTLTEILVLIPPRPRNAIPESIASHSSLFPSLPFYLSLSLSLWPISGDSSSCRRWPKTEEEAVVEEIPNTKHTCWPPDIF